MMMMRAWLALLCVLLLGGCATRGALSVPCAQFANLRQEPVPSALDNAIHGDGAALVDPAASPISRLLGERLARPVDPAALGPGASASPAVLLLSGGGQWGAFGAAFLNQLHATNRLPDFAVVTGISTGALQALFVAVGDDAAYEKMIASYSPASEKEVVRRNSKALAALTGSFAGLKPLRARIEDALCADPDGAAPCLLDRLRALEGRKLVLIGFVEARSGRFHYVDAVRVANLASRRAARDCLTGAALASAAMPVFFQQVRVGKTTYYDGGVRQSVFESGVATEVEAVGRAAVSKGLITLVQPTADRAFEGTLPLYVVRNGPTELKPNARPDKAADALTAAERAEAILVSQMEVASIAALRLAHPSGAIKLVTANGYDVSGACSKGDAMFDPVFMECLRSFGAKRAGTDGDPWTMLPPISIP